MFIPQLLSLFVSIHALALPVRCDQPLNVSREAESRVGKELFTPLGIGLALEGISVEGKKLVCRLVCLDRTGYTEPFRLRILSQLYDAIPLGESIDPTEWEIGALITLAATLPEDLPLGSCEVDLASKMGRLILGKTSLYAGTHLPPMLEGWRFRRRSGLTPLLDALMVDSGVGLDGETITFACNSAPTPAGAVGIERTFKVERGATVTIGLEIHDSYPTRGGLGNLEQRVYANDALISQHDVGGDLSVGWYSVDTTIVVPTGSLTLRAEVLPLRPLGPWGWGVASRTAVRNVRVVQ